MTKTSKSKISGTQTEQKQKHIANITERTLLVDEARAIERVKQWGHMVAPVMVYDPWRNLVPSEVHYWEQAKQYKKILKHANAFNPHEEVNAHMNQVVKRLGKDYDLEVRGTEYSNNDFNMHIEVLSKKFFGQVKDSFEEDDTVQCGLDMYNGIETYLALGGSMYTYRLRCQNGSVAKGKELGTFSIPGVANAEIRIARMEEGIIQVFDKFTQIIEAYTKAAQIKINLKKANAYVLALNRLPTEHMPKSFEIDPDYTEKLKRFQKKNENMDLNEILNLGLKDPKAAPLPVTKVRDNPSLWYVFNETTSSINRKHEKTFESGKFEGRPKLNFSTLARQTDALHKEMFAMVNKKRKEYRD